MKMCFHALAALTLALPVAMVTPAHAAAALPALPYDVNGDGYPELVVGAPDLQVGLLKGAGGVVVVPASKKGLALRERVITQDSPGVAGKAEKGDAFGAAVTSADFDRDGYADLAIGSPLENIGTREYTGSVTIVYGSPTGLDTGRSTSINLPGAVYLGSALVAADFTGDGYQDLAVASPSEDILDDPRQADSPVGVVHILHGGPDGITTTGASAVRRQSDATGIDVRFGRALAAGDLDDDGNTDLIVGSQGFLGEEGSGPGSVSVCRGARGGPTGCTRVTYAEHLAGLESLAVGNVSGSATPEIVAGAPGGYGTPGRVVILQLKGAQATSLAKSTELTQDSPGVPGSEEGDQFGASLAVDDIDRDGHDDMVIGAPYENGERGRVTVVRGSSGDYATSGNYTYGQNTKGVPGKAEKNDEFGSSITLLDHDSDGRLDLSVGAPGENTSDGAVTILRGSGTRFTTRGSKTFGLDTLGYAHPSNASFGYALGSAFWSSF